MVDRAARVRSVTLTGLVALLMPAALVPAVAQVAEVAEVAEVAQVAQVAQVTQVTQVTQVANTVNPGCPPLAQPWQHQPTDADIVQRQFNRASAVLIATSKRVDAVKVTGAGLPRTAQSYELTVLKAIKGEKVSVVTNDFGECGGHYLTNGPMVDGVRYLVFVSGLSAQAFYRLDGKDPEAKAKALLEKAGVSR